MIDLLNIFFLNFKNHLAVCRIANCDSNKDKIKKDLQILFSKRDLNEQNKIYTGLLKFYGKEQVENVIKDSFALFDTDMINKNYDIIMMLDMYAFLNEHNINFINNHIQNVLNSHKILCEQYMQKILNSPVKSQYSDDIIEKFNQIIKDIELYAGHVDVVKNLQDKINNLNKDLENAINTIKNHELEISSQRNINSELSTKILLDRDKMLNYTNEILGKNKENIQLQEKIKKEEYSKKRITTNIYVFFAGVMSGAMCVGIYAMMLAKKL